MSGGKVLEADEVSGLTFSVAMKREMFPECQVLVYSQHDGETLADSVSFHVTADHLNSVSLLMNKSANIHGMSVRRCS